MPQYADIIDNRNRYLKDEINDRLSASSSVKFATGYLYLSGFYQIAESLAELEEAKILVGNNLNQKTIEELAQAIPSEEELCKEVENRSFERPSDRKKRTQQVAKGIEANISTLPHSLEKEEKMLRLSELIYDGKIKVKVYTKHPLHAKAYIFKFKEETARGAGAEGIGIIGSSNLTLSGFTLNTELNTYVRNQNNYEELNGWFDCLWEEAVPFEDVLTEMLEESWVLKTVNPYDIYILTLYHLVQSSMPEYTEQFWFWENRSFMKRLRESFSNFNDLYSFQKVAIRQAIRYGEEIQDRIYRYDQEKLEDYLETFGHQQPYNTDDFELNRLSYDLKHDIDVLKKIQDQLETIPENKDPKFDVLLSKVLQIQKDKPKVLIFSEFADTVEYLHKRLKKILDNVDFATGDVKRLGAKIGAFAPKANDYRGGSLRDFPYRIDIMA